MQLANPLQYPLAVLAAGIVLIVAVRVVGLPGWIALPVAVIVATAGASVMQMRSPQPINLGNRELEREFTNVQQQARQVAAKAENLRAEAERLLTESSQIELLSTVQYACDRALELPGKIDRYATRLQGSSSLLSEQELQQQLTAAEAKKRNSSGVARQQIEELIASLQRNLQLARQGRDARQAQVISLSTLVSDSAGALQQLQNRLRSANLEDASQIQEMRSLSDELSSFQTSIDVLVSRT